MATISIEDNDFISYISYEDSVKYFSGRLGADLWDNTTEPNRKKALITATQKMNCLRYKGSKCEEAQALQFPRYVPANYLSKKTYTDVVNGIEVNGRLVVYVDIDENIKNACCEEAIALLEFQNSAHIKNQKLGITSIDVGVGSVSYSPTGNDLISTEALDYLGKYLQKMGRVV